MRIIGIDPSLSSTGLAFAVPAWDRLDLRTIGGEAEADDDPLEARVDRVARISRRFDQHLDEFDQDTAAAGPLLLVIETRDFQTKTREAGKATDRAGLWLQLMLVGRLYGAHLVGVAPTTLKVYATNDGRASKVAVQEAVQARYGVSCRNGDEADALTLAAMAADVYGCPLAPAPDRHRRSLIKPVWPKVPGRPRPGVPSDTDRKR